MREVKFNFDNTTLKEVERIINTRAKKQPKVLLIPKSVIERIGIEKTIEFIYEKFGYKMKVEDITESQYYFKEIARGI